MQIRISHLLSRIFLLAVVSVIPAHAGSGTFRPYVSYPVSNETMAIGDVNSDGIPDMVAVSRDGTINVLLGIGDGNFQPAVSYPNGTGPYPDAMVLADVNKDGILDLIAGGSPAVPTINVSLGNGDGTFQPYLESPSPQMIGSMAVGDLDRDGNVDLAIAWEGLNDLCGLLVMLGKGDGTFEEGQLIDLPLATYPNSVKLIDLNRDGRLDLAFSTQLFGGLGVSLGRGNGTFRPVTYYDLGGTQFGIQGIAFADLNGDHILDVVGVSAFGYPDLQVVLGDGSGGFPGPRTLFLTIGWPCAVRLSDFNSDQITDAVALSGSEISVFSGHGDGTFQARAKYAIPSNVYSNVPMFAIELNGDSAPDIVISSPIGGTILVLLNDSGTGVKLASSANPSPPGDPVTFTITVSPSFADAGTPTGVVAFKADNIVLGKVPVTGGVATVTTSTLSSGTHTIQAVYSGDRFFNQHVAAPLMQVVQ